MYRLLVLTTLLFSTETFARRILITSFEPFGDRTINGSHEAAKALTAYNTPLAEGVEYVICQLPVEYDLASEKAKQCYEQMDPKPDMVLSLGEGGCDIRLETRGVNFDNTPSADNGGNVRLEQTIDANGRPYEVFNMPVADMFCATEVEVGPPHRASTDAGYYVCNNTAYNLARHFKPMNVPYGFIHVPVTERCQYSTPMSVAEKLNRMTDAALNVIHQNNGCPPVLTPPDLSDLLDVSRRACLEEFNNQTRNLYSVNFGSGDVVTPDKKKINK